MLSAHGVVDVGVRGQLRALPRPTPLLRCLAEQSRDPSPPELGPDVDALQEGDGARVAAIDVVGTDGYFGEAGRSGCSEVTARKTANRDGSATICAISASCSAPSVSSHSRPLISSQLPSAGSLSCLTSTIGSPRSMEAGSLTDSWPAVNRDLRRLFELRAAPHRPARRPPTRS